MSKTNMKPTVGTPQVEKSRKPENINDKGQSSGNFRNTYLEKIGLHLDPFITPVAEQELAISTFATDWLKPNVSPESIIPSFFSYFSSPGFTNLELQNPLEFLKEKRPTIIYGNPGMGKTTLRLTLEAELRRERNNALIVTYLPGEYLPFALTDETHWGQLTEAVAIDLFIQIVENFNPLAQTPTDEQIQALHRQIRLGGRPIKRLIHHLIEAKESRFGIGHCWSLVGRSTVKYVPRSRELVELLITASSLSNDLSLTYDTRRELLESSIRDAEIWGFKEVFILIDGVDNHQREQLLIEELIEPLLHQMTEWQKQGIFLKLFLPTELKDYASGFVYSIYESSDKLLATPTEAIIEWNDQQLKELLVARFRAAKSRRSSFEDIAGVGLQSRLDFLILKAAAGSPRRLITLVSALIDVHVRRGSNDVSLTIDDWNEMREAWVDAIDPAYKPPAAPTTLSLYGK